MWTHTLISDPRPTSPPPTSTLGAFARVRRAAAEIGPETIEQIAHRVVELLRLDPLRAEDTESQSTKLMDARQLAKHLGLNRAWIYEHANELGAIVLGDGPRPRLRFDPEAAAQVLRTRRRRREKPGYVAQAAERSRPARRRRRTEDTVPLLPIHGPTVRGIRVRGVRFPFAIAHRKRI